MVGPAANPWELQFREHPPKKHGIFEHTKSNQTPSHTFYIAGILLSYAFSIGEKTQGTQDANIFVTLLLYLSHDDPDSDPMFFLWGKLGPGLFLGKLLDGNVKSRVLPHWDVPKHLGERMGPWNQNFGGA
jgi:hypothetical protein